eukprot:gene38316-46562_t
MASSQRSVNSTEVSRSVEDMLAWEQERLQKLAIRAHEKAQRESAEVTGKPKITKKAQILTQKMKAEIAAEDDDMDALSSDYLSVVAHSVGSKSVGERLYEYDEVQRLKKAHLRSVLEEEARQSAKPQLNPVSQELAGRRDREVVHERLYNQFEQRQLQSQINGFLADGHLASHDEQTGQKLFAPRINKTSQQLVGEQGDRDVFQALYAQKDEKARRLLQRQRLSQLRDERARQPKINPRSAQIASSARGHNLLDRLAKPIGELKESVKKTVPVYSFRPEINAESRAYVQRSGRGHLYAGSDADAGAALGSSSGAGGVVFMLDEDGRELQVPREALLHDPHDDPHSSSYSSYGYSSYGYSGHSSGHSSGGGPANTIYERNLLWERERRERLAREARRKESEELGECSFAPALHMHTAGH